MVILAKVLDNRGQWLGNPDIECLSQNLNYKPEAQPSEPLAIAEAPVLR